MRCFWFPEVKTPDTQSELFFAAILAVLTGDPSKTASLLDCITQPLPPLPTDPQALQELIEEDPDMPCETPATKGVLKSLLAKTTPVQDDLFQCTTAPGAL